MAATNQHVSSGPATTAVTSILLGIGAILVALRCYVRLLMTKNFGWDDGIMVFTLGVLIAGDVVIFKMVAIGAGYHLTELADPEAAALLLLKWNSVYQALNVIGAFFTKLSIGIFLLRLKNSKNIRVTIWIFLTPLALSTLVVVFTVLLQCIPLDALWTPTTEGRCISQNVPLTASYVQSGFAILADLFLTASPIAILWNIKISRSKKVGICGLMSLGLMATIANALRNAYIPNLTESDFTYTIVPIVLVADLEFSLAVIAACIPTLMPLFKKQKDRMTYSKMSGKQASGSPSQNHIGSNRGPAAHTQDFSTVTTVSQGYPLHDLNDNCNDKDKARIMLQQSYTVERT
ncbi:hypothetical protein F4813DRAFT_388232 [Daldinia decipiens]|uniref:uncharacterized protein n=1 Tax=Daldinia decipiens TaxID=326647 RepID=UPI0020C38587|nr:uncharacterized protein F4813DRAFT_388232 [Daldinia decipiens]KAI1658974.1 hypothetical protein F4813DRAFT_388232 [Daldinia decipiens]